MRHTLWFVTFPRIPFALTAFGDGKAYPTALSVTDFLLTPTSPDDSSSRSCTTCPTLQLATLYRSHSFAHTIDSSRVFEARPSTLSKCTKIWAFDAAAWSGGAVLKSSRSALNGLTICLMTRLLRSSTCPSKSLSKRRSLEQREAGVLWQLLCKLLLQQASSECPKKTLKMKTSEMKSQKSVHLASAGTPLSKSSPLDWQQRRP